MSVEPHHSKWKQCIDGVHVLLVEDNALNQDVACGMLAHAGATVDVLDNGLKALQHLAGSKHYDIILMDVRMPVMDGCTAAKKIREELNLTTPILAMTANVMRSERDTCIAAGMTDFVAKPIDMEQMFATILRNVPGAKSRGVAVPLKPQRIAPEPEPESPHSQNFYADPLMQAGKNDETYRKRMLGLIRNVVLQSPAQFVDAKQLWQAGNAVEAAEILHGMRSSLGTVGAKHFSAATLAIEKALREGQNDSASELFEFAKISLDITMREAHWWLAQQPD